MPLVTTFLGGSSNQSALSITSAAISTSGNTVWEFIDGGTPSIALTAGTWLLSALLPAGGSNPTPYFNSTSGVNTDQWTAQEVNVGVDNYVVIKSALVKISTSLTVYANNFGQGHFFATQIQ